MDTLTHALSGALLARATEPKAPRTDQLPRRLRMWVGFWAAAFPDSDFIVRFTDPLTYLARHRHSHPGRRNHGLRHHGLRAILDVAGADSDNVHHRSVLHCDHRRGTDC